MRLPYTTSQDADAAWSKNGDAWMDHRPLSTLPLMKEFAYWDAWTRNPIESAYWDPFDIEAQHSRVQVPALNLSGWNDDPYGQPGAIRNFAGMRAHGGSDAARRGQRLVMGPWTHGVPSMTRTTYAGTDYGPNATFDFVEEQLRFFDYWLKKQDDGYSSQPPVRIFVMGENRWRDEHSWPVANTVVQSWLLSSDGRLSVSPEDRAAGPNAVRLRPAERGARAASDRYQPGQLDAGHEACRRHRVHERTARFSDRDHRSGPRTSLVHVVRSRHRRDRAHSRRAAGRIVVRVDEHLRSPSRTVPQH